MKKRVEKVSVVKCKTYKQAEVDKAIEKVVELLDFDFSKYEGKKVLLKPNIVTANVQDKVATLTNPSIVTAICKLLKKKGIKKIFIGESSFMATDDNFKNSGIEKVAKEQGAKVLVFEQDKLVKIRDKKAKILKEFSVAKTLKDVDLIVNIPKMKTHILTKYTGAIKNLYGVIPGGMKQKLHTLAKGENNFSNLLIDIYENVCPELNILDGVIGMEGHGPTSGKGKNVGLILASKNAVALDIAMVKIMGYKEKKVSTLKIAIKRKVYPNFNFELVGLKKLPLINFIKPRGENTVSKLREIFRQKPIVVDENKCIQCGLCAKKCPVKAITLKPYPVIDFKKCIRCFCCMEICPQDALHLKGVKD